MAFNLTVPTQKCPICGQQYDASKEGEIRHYINHVNERKLAYVWSAIKGTNVFMRVDCVESNVDMYLTARMIPKGIEQLFNVDLMDWVSLNPTKDKRVTLTTLEDSNEAVKARERNRHHSIETSTPNGIACPDCGSELRDIETPVIMIPATTSTWCPACDYRGRRLI